MEKEIKIIPPKGYEIDKENSTFECIKFKPIVKRWRDTNPRIKGYFTSGNKRNRCLYTDDIWDINNHNIFVTEKQAKSASAMAQISQIMANDERFGGIVTDEEWNNMTIKYCIMRHYNYKITVGNSQVKYYFLSFHTPEQRDLFLKENEDLVKDYLMID